MNTLKQTLESLISTFDNNQLLSFTDVMDVEIFSRRNGNCLSEECTELINNFDNNQLLSFSLLKSIETQFNLKMETLTQWQVWVSKDSQPIIISVPFKNVNDAQEFIWEQIGKRPASMFKL